MKNVDIFEFMDYKAFLRETSRAGSGRSHGFKKKLASELRCRPSYLSQILNGKPHLTLEQAVHLNHFFGHDRLESKYFFLLIELARAGSKPLRDFLLEQISELKKGRFDFKIRLKETEDVPPEQQHKYYSTWFYSAIHMLLAVPEFQEAQSIAQYLNLPLDLVKEAMTFLEEIGLVEKIKGRYEFSQKRIHLGNDSIFVQRHHINWRSQALQSVEKNLAEDMHYSSVIAISKADSEKIKKILLHSIEEAREVIKPSKEEAVYALTIDLFKL